MKIKMPQFKKNMSHPNFIIGAFSFLLLLAGVLLSGNNFMFGGYMMAAAFALGFIHWIWSMVNVFTDHNLDKRSKMFWTIMVIILPPLGGMYYYAMKRKNVQM